MVINEKRYEPLKSVVIVNVDMSWIEDVLNKIKINVLKFNKPGIPLIQYTKLKINLNVEPYTYEMNSEDDITSANSKIRKAIDNGTLISITITTRIGLEKTFSRDEVLALWGLDLKDDMVYLEFYKDVVFNILYSKELVYLCSENKHCNGSVDILELLNTFPSDIIDTDLKYDISRYIKDDEATKTIHNTQLAEVFNVARQYPFNVKKITVSKFTIKIDIYDDIRAIRWEEIDSENKKSINQS